MARMIKHIHSVCLFWFIIISWEWKTFIRIIFSCASPALGKSLHCQLVSLAQWKHPQRYQRTLHHKKRSMKSVNGFRYVMYDIHECLITIQQFCNGNKHYQLKKIILFHRLHLVLNSVYIRTSSITSEHYNVIRVPLECKRCQDDLDLESRMSRLLTWKLAIMLLARVKMRWRWDRDWHCK